MSMPSLMTPEEIASYNLRRNALRLQYQRGMARNAYEQGQAGLNHGMQQSALTRKWGLQLEKLPGQYARSGMMNSGVYQNGLKNYWTQRQAEFDQSARGYSQQLSDLGQQGLDLSAQQAAGMNLVEADANARRAQIAAMIRSIV